MGQRSSSPVTVPATVTVEVSGTPYTWVGTLVLEQMPETVPLVVRRALEYIEDHLDDRDLGLAVVARSIPVAKSYLARRFREACGVTCNTYIETRRAARLRRGEDLKRPSVDEAE